MTLIVAWGDVCLHPASCTVAPTSVLRGLLFHIRSSERFSKFKAQLLELLEPPQHPAVDDSDEMHVDDGEHAPTSVPSQEPTEEVKRRFRCAVLRKHYALQSAQFKFSVAYTCAVCRPPFEPHIWY